MSAALAAALGAAAGVDRTAFGQTLLSHPGVIAALTGWAVGAPREGAWLGLVLSLLATPHQPVGRERLRDWSSAAVAACCAAGPHREPWAWGVALAMALLVAWAGGLAIAAVRRVNARAVDALRARVAAQQDFPLERLEQVHLACGGLELARGGLVALAATLAIAAALAMLDPVLAVPERHALAVFWRVAPLVGLPLALRLRAGGVPRRWLWPGVLVGLVAAWVWGGGAVTSQPSPSSWWRLWAVQASWSPGAMQGLGMAVAGLPWLRRSPLDGAARREWLEQQLEFRNTNPHLAGLVLGATLRFREQAAPAPAQRFESGLDRAAGALGDALIWGGLWPACGLLGAAGAWLLGAPAAAAAWAGFALLQAWMRTQGMRRGYAAGPGVLDLLERPRWRRAVTIARGAALAAAGVVAGVLLLTLVRASMAFATPGAWLGACVAAAVVGVLVALRSWPPERGAVLALAAAWAGARVWEWLG